MNRKTLITLLGDLIGALSLFGTLWIALLIGYAVGG